MSIAAHETQRADASASVDADLPYASLTDEAPAVLAGPKARLAGEAPWWNPLIQFSFLLLALFAWWLVTRAGLVSRLLLPSPVSVLNELLQFLGEADFWYDIWVTITTILSAYFLASICGIVAGVLIGQSRFACDVVQPIFSAIFSIPLIIIYPLILFFAGLGPSSKIIFAAIYGFFPVALSSMSAFAHVPEKWLRYVSTLSNDRVLIARRLLLPAALHEVLGGLRVGYVVTFASVIAGEMIASISGIGRLISYNAEILEPARMYALIAIVVVFAAVVNHVLSRFSQGRHE